LINFANYLKKKPPVLEHLINLVEITSYSLGWFIFFSALPSASSA